MAIAIVGGNDQTAPPGAAVAMPPSVRITGARGNPIPNISVTFRVTEGGGTIIPASPSTLRTDTSGVVSLNAWVLGPIEGRNTLTVHALDTEGQSVKFTATAAREFLSLSEGGSHSCGLTRTGAAYCWGDNTYGQLGDGSRVNRSTPVPVVGGLKFKSVSTSTGVVGNGADFSCGVASDGTGYCWGFNNFGQLGDESVPYSLSPTRISTALRLESISAGAFHACGLTSQGQAYCWGNNLLNQLGAEVGDQSAVPVLVSADREFTALEVDAFQTCGRLPGGGSHCWGLDLDGSAGRGLTTTTHMPARLRAPPPPKGVRSTLEGPGQANPDVTYTCQSDLTGEGLVDVRDLGIVLSNWGRIDLPAVDINGDGIVDIMDLGWLLSEWTGHEYPRLKIVAPEWTGSAWDVDENGTLDVVDLGDHSAGTPRDFEFLITNVGDGKMLCAKVSHQWPGERPEPPITLLEDGQETQVLRLSVVKGDTDTIGIRFRPESEVLWKTWLVVLSNGGDQRHRVVGETFEKCSDQELRLDPPSTTNDECSTLARLLDGEYLGIEREPEPSSLLLPRAIALKDDYIVPTRIELYNYMETCIDEFFCAERKRHSLLALTMRVDLGIQAGRVVNGGGNICIDRSLAGRLHEAIEAAKLLGALHTGLQAICKVWDGCVMPLGASYNEGFSLALEGIARIECLDRAELEWAVLGEYFWFRRTKDKWDAFNSIDEAWLDPLMEKLGLKTEFVDATPEQRQHMLDYLESLWDAYNYAPDIGARYTEGKLIGLCAVKKVTGLDQLEAECQ